VSSSLALRLAATGTDWITTTAPAADILTELLAEGRRFFESDTTFKQGYVAIESMTGWRNIGVEYSQRPDRPDLNETFCYRLRDEDHLSMAIRDSALLECCRNAQRILDAVAANALHELAEHLGLMDKVPRIHTAQESWLQLNWSHPAVTERDFIQDAHEDGHLVTLLLADADGLEVLDRQAGWVGVRPSPERVICFAGECGALLTDDAIQPMQHRVRVHREVASRLSVAYFVNPDLDQHLVPWVDGLRNRGVDLLRWGQENPARFGLPQL